jgi:hypothetical protein
MRIFGNCPHDEDYVKDKWEGRQTKPSTSSTSGIFLEVFRGMRFQLIVVMGAVLAICLFSCGKSDNQESDRSECLADSAYAAALIGHLRANFDDIHDVSMRFHHLDHDINGLIRIDMHWEQGRMTSSSVTLNETGSEDLARALTAAIEKWQIEELTGPFDFSLPLKITIVGSDDSTFHEKGILTGEVTDGRGNPIKDAQLLLRSPDDPTAELTPCYSNREGIFVKTLIPVGRWQIECTVPGSEDISVKSAEFEQGEHVREKFIIEKAR